MRRTYAAQSPRASAELPRLGAPVTYLGRRPRGYGGGARLAPCADIELAQDRGDVVGDGPLGEKSAPRCPCSVTPRATSARISSSRVVKFAGFSWVPGRGPRQPVGAALAQAARRSPRRPSSRRCSLEGTKKRRLVVGVSERERVLVGTPELRPDVRRAPPLAAIWKRVGLGSAGGTSSTPARQRQ